MGKYWGQKNHFWCSMVKQFGVSKALPLSFLGRLGCLQKPNLKRTDRDDWLVAWRRPVLNFNVLSEKVMEILCNIPFSPKQLKSRSKLLIWLWWKKSQRLGRFLIKRCGVILPRWFKNWIYKKKNKSLFKYSPPKGIRRLTNLLALKNLQHQLRA